VTSNELILYSAEAIPDSKRVAITLTMNRPDELNAMSSELIAALDVALDQVESSENVSVLFITGSGRAFSAGGDLKNYRELQKDPIGFSKFVADLHRTFGRLRTLSVPTVALVNGVTAAGGLELVLNCDLAVAAESARIGDGHLNFGQMGGGGVLTLLARYVGIQRAAELMFTGELLGATEAAEWGLVNRVVPDAELTQYAATFARQVAAKSPLAVANAKKVMTEVWSRALGVEEGLNLELELNVKYCTTSYDAPEGLRAFSEKRPPKFEGR
jgi:enoyl-CoA hydratase